VSGGGIQRVLPEKKHPLKGSLRSRDRPWSRTSADSKFEKHKWPGGGGQEGGGRGKANLETSGELIVGKGDSELQRVGRGEAAG